MSTLSLMMGRRCRCRCPGEVNRVFKSTLFLFFFLLLVPSSAFQTRNGIVRHGRRTSTTTTTTTTTTTPSAPCSSLRASDGGEDEAAVAFDSLAKFDAKQLDFTMGYLNKHHRDVLQSLAMAFSDVGSKAKKGSFWGGSYQIVDTTIVDLNSRSISLNVEVKEGNKDPTVEHITIDLDAHPVDSMTREFPTLPVLAPPQPGTNHIDDFVRRLNRLCCIANQPATTGKLIQLAFQIGGTGVGKLRENMYLNQVPHNRYVRQYFYEMAADAVLDAVQLCEEGAIGNRMKIVCKFPELNPSMDSYRIGTLLELARTISIQLARKAKKRVRVCVQGSMGVGIFTGVPKQLNGVARLLQIMDWQSEPGEENEGMVGDYVRFGAIGAEHVVDEHVAADNDGNSRLVERDDVFVLLNPQNMVGLESSIMGLLEEMVDAAGKDRPVILINPDLKDRASAQGQQGIRGRKERTELAESFETIYQFQNIYVSGTSYFPILGAVCKFGPTQAWVAHQRRDLRDNAGEIYVPVLSTENMPDSEVIMSTFET